MFKLTAILNVAVVGIDLAVRRPTAVVALRGCEVFYMGLAGEDGEVLRVASLARPRVVAIDAPLSLPEGGRGLRDVEVELRRRGYKLLPPLMGPMRLLTERGVRLSQALGAEVVEVHPLTSLRAMGLSRRRVAEWLGVEHGDLVDAAAAALTALAYLQGRYERIGPFVLPTARVCL